MVKYIYTRNSSILTPNVGIRTLKIWQNFRNHVLATKK
jgi:hypothetical protein